MLVIKVTPLSLDNNPRRSPTLPFLPSLHFLRFLNSLTPSRTCLYAARSELAAGLWGAGSTRLACRRASFARFHYDRPYLNRQGPTNSQKCKLGQHPKRELPFGADTVLEDGGAILGDGHLELGGPGGGLGEFVRGGEHFPVAADGLVDLDGDGRVLVVAQGDLEFHLPDASRDALVVGLLALGDDIEGVADVHGDGFVFGCVIDVVFANEEDAAFRVFLIDTQVAAGQGHA